MAKLASLQLGLKLSLEKIIVAFKTYQHHKIHDFKYVENAFIIEKNKRQISTKKFRDCWLKIFTFDSTLSVVMFPLLVHSESIRTWTGLTTKGAIMSLMKDMLWFDMLTHTELSPGRILTNCTLPNTCSFVFSHHGCQVLLMIIENIGIRVWRISTWILIDSSGSRPLRVIFTSSVTVQLNQPTMLHKIAFKRRQ